MGARYIMGYYAPWDIDDKGRPVDYGGNLVQFRKMRTRSDVVHAVRVPAGNMPWGWLPGHMDAEMRAGAKSCPDDSPITCFICLMFVP